MPSTGRLLLLSALGLVVSCDGRSEVPDAGGLDNDAGFSVADAGPLDGGERDAGTGPSDGGGHDAGAGPSDGGEDDAGEPRPAELREVQSWDAGRAARGLAALTVAPLGGRLVPGAALGNLWIEWGLAAPPADYWPRFRARYGVYEAPFPNDGLPLGIRDAGDGYVTFDCLLCHAGKIAGQPLLGAPNTLLDIQGLSDDLVALAARFSQPPAFVLSGRTGAAGANDAMGMGLEFSTLYGPPDAGIETHLGFQRPPAWWTLRFKSRGYLDGSGDAAGYRPMMANMLAFGLSFAELQAKTDIFEDIRHYILSLPSPQWPFAQPDAGSWRAGRALFEAQCAGCHGVHHGGETYPNLVVDPGTDPVREERMGVREVAWVNTSWFGVPPIAETSGYLAPPLPGIWARAPYLHNGSIPTLAALLDPASRPARWKRTGAEALDYDESSVGWRFEVITGATTDATIDGRKVYDTSRPGLSNQGHTFGSDLDADDRAALLDYLKVL